MSSPFGNEPRRHTSHSRSSSFTMCEDRTFTPDTLSEESDPAVSQSWDFSQINIDNFGFIPDRRPAPYIFRGGETQSSPSIPNDIGGPSAIPDRCPAPYAVRAGRSPSSPTVLDDTNSAFAIPDRRAAPYVFRAGRAPSSPSILSNTSPEVPIVVTPQEELPQPSHGSRQQNRMPVINDWANPSEVAESNENDFSSDHIEARSSLSPHPNYSRRTSGTSSILTDGSDDDVEPYSVEDEEAPIEPFFTEQFQATLQGSYIVAKDVSKKLKKLRKSFENDADFLRLLNHAIELSVPREPNTRTIAVLGASGEGKSSLINSLLHTPELARTDDSGAACTSVVVEYRQKTAAHAAPFTIEAEYLSGPEIKELVTELLWNFRQIQLPLFQQDHLSNEEYQRIERESAQAWSALEAAFSHQPSFRRELLSDKSDGAMERITEKLIDWTQDIQWPGGDDSGLWKSSAETAEECNDMISSFMVDRLWVFTKIIRVYLDAEVLKAGIVLADLPGLQDANLARVRITEKYILNSDHVFLVTQISRAITNNTLQSALYAELARHIPLAWEESAGNSMSLKVAVICTRSDDINITTAKRTFAGVGKPITNAEATKMDQDIEEARRRGNRKLKKELERKRQWRYVEARNTHVRNRLQAGYKKKVPEGTLNVFCISNKAYLTYSERGNTEMVQKSGIPKLRQFSRQITANVRLLQSLHFIRSELPSLLNSIRIWIESAESPAPTRARAEAIDAVLNIHKASKGKINALINSAKLEYHQDLHDHLTITCANRFKYWETAAKHEADQWSKWPHYQTYNAFCRHNGEHSTPAVGYYNWNAQIIWKMRTELEMPWEILEGEIPLSAKKVLENAKHEFSELKSYLQTNGFASSLVDGIAFGVQDFEYKCTLKEQEFTKGLKTIRGYASEPNSSSYVVMEMIPAYREASSQGGQGMSRRQKSIVSDRITEVLFPLISDRIRDDTLALVDDSFGALESMSNSVFDSIYSDLSMAVEARRQQENSNGITAEATRLRTGFLRELMTLRERQIGHMRSVNAY